MSVEITVQPRDEFQIFRSSNSTVMMLWQTDTEGQTDRHSSWASHKCSILWLTSFFCFLSFSITTPRYVNSSTCPVLSSSIFTYNSSSSAMLLLSLMFFSELYFRRFVFRMLMLSHFLLSFSFKHFVSARVQNVVLLTLVDALSLYLK